MATHNHQINCFTVFFQACQSSTAHHHNLRNLGLNLFGQLHSPTDLCQTENYCLFFGILPEVLPCIVAAILLLGCPMELIQLSLKFVVLKPLLFIELLSFLILVPLSFLTLVSLSFLILAPTVQTHSFQVLKAATLV